MKTPQPILELTRGAVVESAHLGSIVVVDATGKLLHFWGNPLTTSFLRSSAKPFQVIPFVEHGGVEHFQFTAGELAISCASHQTAQIHLDTVKSMQSKVGIEEGHLMCGAHLPEDAAMLKHVIKHDIHPTPNFNNCSGKHTAMLAYAKMRGLPLDTYLNPAHPIQQDILNVVSDLCKIEAEKIELGIDGCSAPNFALPIIHSALGFARLCDPRELGESRANACRRVTSAMVSHPEMIANHGEFDTELMKVGGGKIITKRGAEGFQSIGLMPGVYGDKGVGIAFKVLDGDASRINDDLVSSTRVRPAVALEILRQLNVLNDMQLRQLAEFGPAMELKNYRGLLTGKSYPVFNLFA